MVDKLGTYNREEELEKAKAILGEGTVRRLQQQRLEFNVARALSTSDDPDDLQDDEICPSCE
jgi:hypothetical protein